MRSFYLPREELKARRSQQSGKREVSSLTEPKSPVQLNSTRSQLQQVSDAQSRLLTDMDRYLRFEDVDVGQLMADKDRLTKENTELKEKIDELVDQIERKNRELEILERSKSKLEQRIGE